LPSGITEFTSRCCGVVIGVKFAAMIQLAVKVLLSLEDLRCEVTGPPNGFGKKKGGHIPKSSGLGNCATASGRHGFARNLTLIATTILRQRRLSWPGSARSKPQRAIENLQPNGKTSPGFGTVPRKSSASVSCSLAQLWKPIEIILRFVRMLRFVRKQVFRTVATSTTRLAYIKPATTSANFRANNAPGRGVNQGNIRTLPRSRCSLRSSLRICAWMVPRVERRRRSFSANQQLRLARQRHFRGSSTRLGPFPPGETSGVDIFR